MGQHSHQCLWFQLRTICGSVKQAITLFFSGLWCCLIELKFIKPLSYRNQLRDSPLDGYLTKALRRIRKSTDEIRTILHNANMDFDKVVNDALNDYLTKIFNSCPFNDDLCLHKNQCITCKSYNLNHR